MQIDVNLIRIVACTICLVVNICVGLVGCTWLSGIFRNPEAASKSTAAAIITFAFLEAGVLIAVVFVFGLK